jgi:flagellar biosynthesis protein FlhG
VAEWDDDGIPQSLPPPASLPRGRRVVAVGGGRGGVGKSVLVTSLGVYFAQLGRSAVICDVDPIGGNLHAMLGVPTAPAVRHDPDGETSLDPVSTLVPGLSILPSAYDLFTATPVKPSRKSHWAQRIGDIQADYVILHLGASTAPVALDLFASADVGIAMTVPEPIAIESTYGFMRALFARAMRRRLMRERHKLKLSERALAGTDPLASPHDIIAALHKYDGGLARVAAYELAKLAPRLVVGQTRLRTDLDLGPAMSAIAVRFLGTALDYLGHVEADDAVWLSVRKRRPLLIESPTSKAARNIERIARRILALLAVRETRAISPDADWAPPAPMNLYEVLGITRTAADDEIRRAYKRQREMFRTGSLPVVSVVTENELLREQSRIEEAYDTLLDPNKRRSYDLSTFPADDSAPAPTERHIDEARRSELLMLQTELMREIHSETIYTGALLKKVRESQGVEVTEIAQRTKISSAQLRAIEDEDWKELPAHVYVQGFVTEVAKFLKLDATQVARTYMRRMRENVEDSAR